MNKLARAEWIKWVSVTVAVAAAAVPLSFILWRTPPGAAAPPPSVLPLLIPIGVVIPALSFGVGVAFVLFGRRLIRANRPSVLSRASFVSVAWLLINWWPHSNFHRVSTGWVNSVMVDYFFHTTVIAATAIVAIFFMTVVREQQTAGEIASGARDLAPASTS